ncbi:hypothetical protein [Streptomyces sp. cg36]|uniref:hypothetical protein n=1 Tax=Streptomyces sp. cg36 TaxID=3238798 RepID=UPI0034E24512
MTNESTRTVNPTAAELLASHMTWEQTSPTTWTTGSHTITEHKPGSFTSTGHAGSVRSLEWSLFNTGARNGMIPLSHWEPIRRALTDLEQDANRR